MVDIVTRGVHHTTYCFQIIVVLLAPLAHVVDVLQHHHHGSFLRSLLRYCHLGLFIDWHISDVAPGQERATLRCLMHFLGHENESFSLLLHLLSLSLRSLDTLRQWVDEHYLIISMTLSLDNLLFPLLVQHLQ